MISSSEGSAPSCQRWDLGGRIILHEINGVLLLLLLGPIARERRGRVL